MTSDMLQVLVYIFIQYVVWFFFFFLHKRSVLYMFIYSSSSLSLSSSFFSFFFSPFSLISSVRSTELFLHDLYISSMEVCIVETGRCSSTRILLFYPRRIFLYNKCDFSHSKLFFLCLRYLGLEPTIWEKLL